MEEVTLQPEQQPSEQQPQNNKTKDPRYKFSKREIGLMVIIVLAIIGVTTFAWQTDKNKKSDINSFASCVAAGNPVMESYPEQCAANGQTWSNPDQKVEVPPVASDQTFIEIKELGVKFEQPEEITGVYFVISDASNIAYFSLNEFKDTDCAADANAQVALGKWTDEEIAADEQLTMSKDVMKKINNFYYLPSGGQAACSADTKIQAKADAMRTALLSSMNNTLVAIE